MMRLCCSSWFSLCLLLFPGSCALTFVSIRTLTVFKAAASRPSRQHNVFVGSSWAQLDPDQPQPPWHFTGQRSEVREKRFKVSNLNTQVTFSSVIVCVCVVGIHHVSGTLTCSHTHLVGTLVQLVLLLWSLFRQQAVMLSVKTTTCCLCMLAR